MLFESQVKAFTTLFISPIHGTLFAVRGIEKVTNHGDTSHFSLNAETS
jgi:hypothetical protein